jgi:hypothetical protein
VGSNPIRSTRREPPLDTVQRGFFVSWPRSMRQRRPWHGTDRGCRPLRYATIAALDAGATPDPRDRSRSTERSRGAFFTDGPYVESKEQVIGFWIMEAPDLDVALKLAAEGSRACNRKVEVRPFL